MNIDMKALARAGARARMAELDQERAALLAHFPELRHPSAATEPERPTGRRRRRRRPMSPAHRKAVGERMRKYWAARRKAEGKK